MRVFFQICNTHEEDHLLLALRLLHLAHFVTESFLISKYPATFRANSVGTHHATLSKMHSITSLLFSISAIVFMMSFHTDYSPGRLDHIRSLEFLCKGSMKENVVVLKLCLTPGHHLHTRLVLHLLLLPLD